MTQFAEVKRLLPNGLCEVYVRRSSACGDSCASCGLCGDRGAAIAIARNECGARQGDIAEVSAKTAHIMWLALLVYLLPAVLAIALGIAAEFFAVGYSAVGIACGFAVGALVILLYSRMRKKEYITVMRVITAAPEI